MATAPETFASEEDHARYVRRLALDADRIEAEARKLAAEAKKLDAEEARLTAERHKLDAEKAKLGGDLRFQPWAILLQGALAAAALMGAGAAVARLLQS